MMPENLDPSVLYVFVCGPGQGESTVIHVPPGDWIVVDSCRTSNQVFAKAILKRFGGRKACLVLTHRHQDHYRGFSDLAEMPDWQVVGCNDRTLVDPDKTEDGEEKLTSELGHVFSLIRHKWRSEPSTEWKTWRMTEKTIGDGRLVSLHPDESFAKGFTTSSSNDENVLSSAMALLWNGNLILLGADTPIPFWQEIREQFSRDFDPATHQLAKIPHHGSLGSLDSKIFNDAQEQTWIVTPFNSSDLPRFDPGDGLDFLLNRNREVHLTGLPVAQAAQESSPCRTTLLKLRDKVKPAPIPFTLPGRVGVDVTPTRGELNNFYLVSIRCGGELRVITSGDGTVVVEQDDVFEKQ